jgi:hypothetical protein
MRARSARQPLRMRIARSSPARRASPPHANPRVATRHRLDQRAARGVGGLGRGRSLCASLRGGSHARLLLLRQLLRLAVESRRGLAGVPLIDERVRVALLKAHGLGVHLGGHSSHGLHGGFACASLSSIPRALGVWRPEHTAPAASDTAMSRLSLLSWRRQNGARLQPRGCGAVRCCVRSPFVENAGWAFAEARPRRSAELFGLQRGRCIARIAARD